MIPAKAVSEARTFYGTVSLKDWMNMPDGRAYKCFQGKITVMSVYDSFGFDPGKGEANWLVMVQGETETIFLLGCQIRGAHQHAEGKDPSKVDTFIVD